MKNSIEKVFYFLLLSSMIITEFVIGQTDVVCRTKFDQCQNEFMNELKQYKLNDFETSYYNLCSSDGSYMRFVDCIRQLKQNECSKQQMHREFCNKRGIKLFSYRYTWKSSIIHDICYRTIPFLNQDFFKYEKCISEELNSPRWYCDVEHYDKTKTTTGQEACKHWKDFRQCISEKVQERCGGIVANISDYLFHVHSSYFSKYLACNLPGEPHTKCWLDSIDSIPTIPKNTNDNEENTSTPRTTTDTSAVITTTNKVLIDKTTKIHQLKPTLSATTTIAPTLSRKLDNKEIRKDSPPPATISSSVISSTPISKVDNEKDEGGEMKNDNNETGYHRSQHNNPNTNPNTNPNANPHHTSFNLRTNLVREAKMKNDQQQQDSREQSYHHQKQDLKLEQFNNHANHADSSPSSFINLLFNLLISNILLFWIIGTI